MSALPELAAHVGMAKACDRLGLSRATVHRQCQVKAPTPTARRRPPLQLSAAEQAEVLAELMYLRFGRSDAAPGLRDPAR